jgi:hypothetical protein
MLRTLDADSVGAGPFFTPSMWSSQCVVPKGSTGSKLDGLQVDFAIALQQGASRDTLVELLAQLWSLSATMPALTAAVHLLSPSAPPKLPKAQLARWAAEHIPFARVEALAAIVAAHAAHPSQGLSLEVAVAGFSLRYGVTFPAASAAAAPQGDAALDALFELRTAGHTSSVRGGNLPSVPGLPPPAGVVTPPLVPPLSGGGQLPSGVVTPPLVPPLFTGGPSPTPQDFAAFLAAIQRPAAPPGPPPSHLSHKDKLLSSLDESLRKGDFIQPAAYSHKRLELVEQLCAQSASSTTVHLANGLKMSTSKTVADIPINLNCMDHYSSGFLFVALRMLDMPDVAPLVSDRLNWFHWMLYVCPVPVERKLEYCVAFALKHHESSNWMDQASIDNALLFRFMAPAESSAWPKAKKTRFYEQEAPEQQSKANKKRPKTNMFPNGKEPPAGEPYSQAYPGPYCMSRVSAGAGDCRKGAACIFSHECSKCGGDHALASCQARRQVPNLRVPAPPVRR